ncbi:peptidyl-tRNA hydrolase domain-containing protein [Microsporum canis CBS 113480]|uniref:Peptidyl-tRNA hydrolase domain-containing protein n=1 Tax=Arthroderma otae (strain ATCC MYA-4605 / CBS 113480) TaxID=554155 RepID=C5FKV7_ARTOC|nr:peptidyl-tRNA hydrolase domain-containing protein [Microsporum canis CBS 113480]EEQ30329.1 peptidyl-tRNA hydrolase domain-containing protein [Microsporum canis CBS 113480]
MKGSLSCVEIVLFFLWTHLHSPPRPMHLARLPTYSRALAQISKQAAQGRFKQHVGDVRFFRTSPPAAVKQMPPRPTIDDSEISGSYLKGSGPGGQKINEYFNKKKYPILYSKLIIHEHPYSAEDKCQNKTNSAVQLIHIPTNTVVKCQATRSQSQNRKIAKQILAEKVELLEKGDQSRAAIVTNVKKKRKASKMKKSRRKYRALEEEKRKKQIEAGLEENVCENEIDGTCETGIMEKNDIKIVTEEK